MKVINIFGGPGCGKSTTTAGVFSLLKLHGVNCELVTEYAKDLTWNEDFKTLSNQYKVTSEQYHRIKRLEGKVDVVITDSPILQGIIYTDDWETERFIRGLAQEFNNVNYLLGRDKPYQTIGRNQTEQEAIHLDKSTKILLDIYEEYTCLDGKWSAVNIIVHEILEDLNIKSKYEVHNLEE